ncbi:hypothetical protein [Ruania alba]|uniref:Uncharacterized protein n=1 Tax=Ruania alba TaxID=648782 RepID=A0A1H5N0S7_9MICO|nr:hypothetical protein [Ruania alba]SEE95163.1 hypothetical protein SAMN04488554_3823 [Ruania alba]
MTHSPHFRPQFGLQGPVMAWQDPWAVAPSDTLRRTGTGVSIASHDAPVSGREFAEMLGTFGADFYLHHVLPGEGDERAMLRDIAAAGLGVVLGNEYGNINGPFVEGTNRYDIPGDLVVAAARSGALRAVLYDEPEHLQINAAQYRRDAVRPHFGSTQDLSAGEAAELIEANAREIVNAVEQASSPRTPVLSEQVFPVLFHTLARAGMTPCPKVMKESFQPLQLATSLGAARQFDRDFWICVDLWGPDIGPWFTRAPGYPGHGPEEYASALRMAYFFGPSHMFTEGLDVLMQHTSEGFLASEYGQVWLEFVRSFVPANPLRWSFRDATATIAFIHAEDSNYGQDDRPFGQPDGRAPERSRSIFDVWHLLSHGSIPRNGTCMHIPGFEFPRHQLNGVDRSEFPFATGVPGVERPTSTHGLFHPMNNVLAFDERVGTQSIRDAKLLIVAGTRLPDRTREMLRARAVDGATVVIAEWLDPTADAGTYWIGRGLWIVTDDFVSDEAVREAVAMHLGPPDRWTQQFGDHELHMYPGDADGTTLEFEIVSR